MKLKIVNINESKNIITEADVNKGYRINAVKALSDKISAAVTKAKYKYKAAGQNGFYIMPPYGYLGALELTKIEAEEPTFEIKIKNMFAADLPVNGKIIKKITYKDLSEIIDDIGLTLAKTLVAPASFTNVSENLSEERLLEYGPWSSIKNIFQKAATTVTDFLDKNSANKAEKKGNEAILQGINNSLSKALSNAIKTLLKDGKQYVTVKSAINDKELVINLKCDFVVAMTFDADPADARKIIASTLLTPLGEVDVKGKTIQQVLAMIGKVLDIKFNSEDIGLDIDKEKSEIEDNKTEEGEASKTTDKFWKYKIGDEAFAELTEEFENNINETYSMNIQPSKYQKAFEKTADDEAKKALVRYFLLKETGGALTEADAKNLNSSIVVDILNIVEDEGFNPNSSSALLYILNCIKKYKKDILKNNVVTTFATKLPKCCKRKETLENIDSMIYRKTLFNSASDIDTLSTLLEYWYGDRYTGASFTKEVLENLSKNSKKNLANKFYIPNPDKFSNITNINELKEWLLLDPTSSGDNKKFRTIKEIESIADAIKNIHNASVETKRKNGDTSVQKIGSKSVVDKIAKEATNKEGVIDVDKLKTILNDEETKNEARKLFAALRTALGEPAI